ncbi:teichoic acids export ABC transporter ATP-binding subunit TagH [Ferdinandcohnia sp. SAFN-114]|uniref:teichoic acids export ABC transporter ATP-binding subunit TagH n=1 Tax=Ferdinandcohnia sp. SAFN-114 TaxID=3387275 RepID=UPI003F7D5749
MSSSVIFNKVTKKYKLFRKTSDKLLDIALPKEYGKNFYALQNISFTAKKGDVIGIIGINGSGKSTLSNLIAGVIQPTSGEITINGEVALISISSGLNNQLTGRENIELKCLMLGFSKQEIKKMTPEIIEFAELGNFIDQPVKSYSSGMKSRLGFAISVTIDPDILVIDEALSVGDKTFANKSLEKMNEFKEKGKTIFFISHSSSQVKEFCQKALWLEAGEIKSFGSVERVIPKYDKFVNRFRKLPKEEQEKIKNEFDERRSRINKVVEEPSEDEDKDDKYYNEKIPNSTRFKKQKKNKKIFWFISLLFVTLLTAGGVLSWDKFFTDNQPKSPEKIEPEVIVENEDAKINTETVEKEPEILEQLDIRYVNVPAARVRDMPDIASSNPVSMVYFGQPILVSEVKEDPNGEMNWIKFKIQDNQEVWISDEVVTELDEQVEEEEFLSKVGTHFNLDLSNLNELFTTDVESLIEEDSNTYTFDQAGRLSEVTYTLSQTTTRNKIATDLAEPQLVNDEQNYLVYHGENYDFVFQGINSNQLDTLVIRPIMKDKDAVIELDLLEDSALEQPTNQTENNITNETEEVSTTPIPPTREEKPKAPAPTPTRPTQPKEPEKPKEPTIPTPKPTEPTVPTEPEPEQPANPTPDPIVPPEEPVVPENPTPDPITPSEP